MEPLIFPGVLADLYPGGTLNVFGRGCAAGTLKPLIYKSYTRPCSADLQPYTRLDTKNVYPNLVPRSSQPSERTSGKVVFCSRQMCQKSGTRRDYACLAIKWMKRSLGSNK